MARLQYSVLLVKRFKKQARSLHPLPYLAVNVNKIATQTMWTRERTVTGKLWRENKTLSDELPTFHNDCTLALCIVWNFDT
mmetsp:Transcript_3952/g.8517  ORF Transcript_3952/g.8517 Transcript_3952/m.8517 type:complete len:81 (+) Transcript_3952:3000-3242(+)